MPTITLPDNSKRKFDNPLSIDDIAKDIGPGLAKATIAGKVNGLLVDASDIIQEDCDLEIVTIRMMRELRLLDTLARIFLLMLLNKFIQMHRWL